MDDPKLDAWIENSVGAVLETMFFAAPLGPAEPEAAGGQVVSARLSFHGTPSGTLGVCISSASARSLAAGFLGEEEAALSEVQTGQVV